MIRLYTEDMSAYQGRCFSKRILHVRLVCVEGITKLPQVSLSKAAPDPQVS